MPRNTEFSTKWLLRLDNTDRVCSRWLAKGKTANSFRCIVCNSDVLITAANAKLTVLNNQLIENNEKLNRLRKKQKK